MNIVNAVNNEITIPKKGISPMLMIGGVLLILIIILAILWATGILKFKKEEEEIEEEDEYDELSKLVSKKMSTL